MPTTTITAILRRADNFQRHHVKQPYHVEPDDGEDLCEVCARARLAAGKCESVWPTPRDVHYDSPLICVECGCLLAGWLTDYGAEEELAHLEEQGFDPEKPEDCWRWMLAENSFMEGSEEHGRLMRLAGLMGRSDAAC